MLKKIIRIPLFIFTIMISTFSVLYAEPVSPTEPNLSTDIGYQAFMKASKTNKYLIAHFYSGTSVNEIVTSYNEARLALKDSLIDVSIDVQNSGASFLIEKYNLKYAPLPLVIIFAPNGATTGSFKSSFSTEQVKDVFRSPKTQQCILAFQDRKLLFINAQNKKTSENKAALDGIRQFEKENPLFGAIELVIIDPKDASETQLLNQLRIKPDISKAQTLLLVPPGRMIGEWSGATDPKEFLKRLQALSKSCSAPSCADPNCK